MATGLLTTACLLVALCADTDGAWPVNDRHFDIPIKLEAARKQGLLARGRPRGRRLKP